MTVLNPSQGTMSKEQLAAGDSREGDVFKPSSCVTVKLHSIRFPTEPEEYFRRDDGSVGFPVNVSLTCVDDLDGANAPGAKHDDCFWFDLDDQDQLDTDMGCNGRRLGMVRGIAFKAFGGTGFSNPGAYPTDGNGEFLSPPWVALKDHLAEATGEWQVQVVQNGDYTNLKAVKA